MFRRLVVRNPVAKFCGHAKRSEVSVKGTVSQLNLFAKRSLSTLLDKKEHGEEAIYIRKMEAERQQAMRERIEKILALEEGHEDKRELEELLNKETKPESSVMSLLTDWKFALPIGMFIAIPALSNEVLVLDAETQLVACFILFCSTMYTQVGGMVSKSLDDYGKQIEDELKQVDEEMFSKLRSAVEADNKALAIEEDFKHYYALKDSLAVAQADLLNHQAEHQFRDAVVKKLDSLVALEESAVAAIRNRMLAEVKQEVIDSFQNDKKVKEAALNSAIAVLAEGAQGKMGKDVVGEVFKTALQNYRARYEKMPAGSDPILVQLEKDMQAVATAPVVEGSGGNVYANFATA